MDEKTITINLQSLFCMLLTIAFIVLKLCNVITWSWIWVFAPLWIPLALVIIIFIGAWILMSR